MRIKISKDDNLCQQLDEQLHMPSYEQLRRQLDEQLDRPSYMQLYGPLWRSVIWAVAWSVGNAVVEVK